MGHSSRLLDLMCWCLVCILPVSALAAEINPAMAWGTGVVKVNGKLIPGALTIYAGDRLVTDAESNATLTDRFSTAMLPPNSAVIYGGNRIQMQYGRALIIARHGTQALLGNLVITPAKATAKFQMRQTDTQLVLAVLDGSVEVTDGTNRVVLTKGEMITRAVAEAKPATQVAQKPVAPLAVSDTAPTTPTTPTTPADAASPPPVAAAHRGIPGWVIGTIGAGAAGGIVGGMAAAGMFRPASPVVP